MLSKFFGFFSLTYQVAKSGFKLRNEGSYLGVFWYLLNPILLFLLLFFVFSSRLGSSIEFYSLYLFLGVIMFNFFQSCTIESTKIISRDYRRLIKSINFSRESLISGVVLKNVFSHLFEVVLFFVIFLFVKGFSVSFFAYFLILFLFAFFVFGFCLLLSCLTVYFVDLENIYAFGVRLLLFATPIFYSVPLDSGLFFVNLFNPLFYFISVARSVVIYNVFPGFFFLLGCLFFSLFFFFLELLGFNKRKFKFAELR